MPQAHRNVNVNVNETQLVSIPDRLARMKGAMKAPQVAETLGVDQVTVYKLAKQGRIPCFRVGTCVRFDPAAIAKWIRMQ